MISNKEPSTSVEEKFSDKLLFGWFHISSLFCNQISHVFDIVMSTQLGHTQQQEDAWPRNVFINSAGSWRKLPENCQAEVLGLKLDTKI